jgi:hypothetical protein
MYPNDPYVVIDALAIAAVALIVLLGRAKPASIRSGIKSRKARVTVKRT